MPDPIPPPPIDSTMTQAVSNAVVQSGASGLGPSAAPQPLSVSAHGGDDPSVTFDFTKGADGKIYGKGDRPPQPSSNLTLRIRQFGGKWLVTAELTQTVNMTAETTAISSSGAQSNYKIDDDQNIGWSQPGVRSSDIRNAERFEKFLPYDLLTAVRQSLWSLQAKNQLYQFVVPSSEPDPRLAVAALLIVAGVFMSVASLVGIGGENGPSPSPSPSGSAAAPTVGPIVATFAGTTTTYRLQAPAPAGSTYQWTNTNTCGTQTGQTTAVFVWDHPDVKGGCPSENVHPGIVTLTISGPVYRATLNYAGGSGPGSSNVAVMSTPAGGGPVATATQIHAGGTPEPVGTGGPNVPLLGGGVVVTAAGAGVAITSKRGLRGFKDFAHRPK